MSDSPTDGNAVATLGRALLNVTLIQVLGYLSKKHKIIPATALPGAGAFIGLISLPMIYFKAVATLDFSTVRVEVLIALVLGKQLLILLSVRLGGMTRSKESEGDAEMRAGAFALLTTNSDDLGLGLPVMGALFPPNIVKMCFVLNATQAMVFNPQIFMLLGIGAAKRDAAAAGAEPPPTRELVVSVLRGQTKNFLNISVVAGLTWNLALGRGRGCPLPFFLESLATVLGSAFGPIVLFLGGAANVGAFAQLAALHSVMLPLLTVLLKVTLLPTFVAAVAGWLGAGPETVDFAFAFSTLPSAASTLVFSAPYAPSEQMASLMNASLLLHKVVGFPVLFLAAAISTTKAHDVVALEAAVAFDAQLLCVGLTAVLLASRLWYAGWGVLPLQPLYGLLLLTFGYSLSAVGGAYLMDTREAQDECVPSPGASWPAAAWGGGEARCTPAWLNPALFAATSCFRWAADAMVVCCAISTCLETRARLSVARQRASTRDIGGAARAALALSRGGNVGGGGGGLNAPLIGLQRSKHRAMPAVWRCAEAAAAVAAGLLLTLPWVLSLHYPEAALDHTLTLWVPYVGSSQPLVYAVVYALGTLALLVAAGLMMAAEAQTNELIGGKKSIKLLRLRRTHSFLVRFECFVFLCATRFALSAAICAGLCAPIKVDGAELTGSLAIMLLVCSLLANSTGLALFFLFGTSEGVFAAPAERLRQAARTFGGDAMESAAAGSGYENVPTAAEAAKKEAGELITKMAVRHRHPTALLGGRHPTQQI